MNFNVLVIFTLLFLGSCSSIGEKVSDLYIALGIMKTPTNQDYQEILEEGRYIAFGRLSIYVDNVNVTQINRCGLGVNGHIDRRGVVIHEDDSGHFLLDLNKRQNTWGLVTCGRASKFFSSKILYEFKPIPFVVDKRVTYLGDIKLYFSSTGTKDGYSLYPEKKPWIEKIDYTLSRKVKTEIEERFHVKADSEFYMDFDGERK